MAKPSPVRTGRAAFFDRTKAMASCSCAVKKMIHPTLSINIKKINGVQFQDLIWILFVWCYNVSVQQYSRNQVSMIAADGFVPVWSQRICNIHNGMCIYIYIYIGLLVISGAPQYYWVICKLIPLVFVYLWIMVIWLHNIYNQYGISALIQYKDAILPI